MRIKQLQNEVDSLKAQRGTGNYFRTGQGGTVIWTKPLKGTGTPTTLTWLA